MGTIRHDIEALGGIAATRELVERGHWRESIEIALMYRAIIRVRKGWYALPDTPADIVRAWRVGGRLACWSALTLHSGIRGDGMLHVEVARNTARLRSPDSRHRRLTPDDAVIVHWSGDGHPIGRTVVPFEPALAQAATCEGSRQRRERAAAAQSPFGLHGSSPAAPPSGLSPPRRR